MRNAAWEANSRVRELLGRYTLVDTLGGGCVDTFRIGDLEVSAQYVQILDTHDRLADRVDHSQIRSALEIGGGFGAYIHVLISNYPDLRKILYVDIPPNLYVGSQYLRSLYGQSVTTYADTRFLNELEFKSTPDLEIMCIPPWQLDRFVGKIDLVHNAHSFVEMPTDVVTNYARLAEGVLADDGAITLVSYGGGDQHTLNPFDLPTAFSREFEVRVQPTLHPNRQDFHFVASAT